MGSFSDYLENKLLDHLFKKGTVNYTSPTIYVALSTANPGESGANIAEPSGGAYARVVTAAADWNAASSGVVTNAANITFPEATLDWGNIAHFALYDALTAGNMLAYGALGSMVTIAANDTPILMAGNISTSLD
jgi:hypothetical protein